MPNFIKIGGGREHFGLFLVDFIWNDPLYEIVIVDTDFFGLFLFWGSSIKFEFSKFSSLVLLLFIILFCSSRFV